MVLCDLCHKEQLCYKFYLYSKKRFGIKKSDLKYGNGEISLMSITKKNPVFSIDPNPPREVNYKTVLMMLYPILYIFIES